MLERCIYILRFIHVGARAERAEFDGAGTGKAALVR